MMPKSLFALIVALGLCAACSAAPAQPATPAAFPQLANTAALSTPATPSTMPSLAATCVPTLVPTPVSVAGPEARPDPMPATREPLMVLPAAKLEWNYAKDNVTLKHASLGEVGPMCAALEVVNQQATVWTDVTGKDSVTLVFNGQLIIVSEGPKVYVDIQYPDWHTSEAAQHGDFAKCESWAWDRIGRAHANNDTVHYFIIRMDGAIEEQTTIFGKGG